MSFKALAWTLLAAMALAGILLLNYWASYQPLSTLVYTGIVLATCGLMNLALPFRFLGIRKRRTGALVLAGGIGLAALALLWPAPVIRAAQRGTLLDQTMPEYQFNETHSTRIHASPEQVMEATRQATFRDMKSLVTLLKIRSVAGGIHETGAALEEMQRMRIIDSFSKAGYLLASNEREILSCGGWNVRASRPIGARTLQEYAAYREPGAAKMAFDFRVEDVGGGWSTLRAETRVVATDEATRRGMGRYWRMIVPGSGLLRIQWLDGIKNRAESMANTRP